MRVLLLLLALAAAPGVCASVHTVGAGHAYPSIREALAHAQDHDTVQVYPGTYREQNLIIGKPVFLQGVDFPLLDGEFTYEILSIRSDSVTVAGFHLVRSGVSSTIDYAAIKIYDAYWVTIADNLIEGAFFGIYSQNSRSCTIRGNRLTGEGRTEQQSANGIHCWKCDDMRIIGNTITGHRDGIYFEFVTHAIIWRNVSLHNMRYGLHFMFSNNDTYVGNIFENNGAGVAVMFSNHVRMYNNYFRENWGDAAYGILLKEISDSHIEGNYFEKNTSGIFMEGASRVEMHRNRFLENGWGLKIQASCMDIVLTHNDFIGNTFDVGSNGTLVLNTFLGNYWNKYEGYDLDRNGRGDVPYRPVSLYSMVIERNPDAAILYRSFVTTLLDRSERVLPSLTPENLMDREPSMKACTV